jgi:hypothetical protein
MIYITDCAEIECLSQGRNQIGALLLPNDVMKFLEVLELKRRSVPKSEQVLKCIDIMDLCIEPEENPEGEEDDD